MALSVARPQSSYASSGLSRRPSGTTILGWLTLALLAFLVAVPVVMLVIGSFSSASLPSDFSLTSLTLNNYVKAYTDPRTYQVLGNSVAYVVGSVGIGVSISLIFTWLIARTDVPARWLWTAAIPLALVVPGMLESMSWVLLFSPKVGFVNRMLSNVFHSGPVFDVYSLLGIITLESLRTVPTSFLLLLPLMIRFDPSLEEAAALSGSTPLATIRRVTLPLLIPGLLAIVIYQAVTVLASFEVPGILGLPAQVYVFSTLIYTYIAGSASSGGFAYGLANALAMLYLVLNLVALFVYARVTRNAAKFAVVTGRAYRPRRISLGRWRWLGAAVLGIYLIVSVLLPLLVLLWVSLTSLIVQPSVSALGRLSGTNWQHLLFAPDSDLVQALVNTALTVLGSATIAVVICLLVAWVSVRTRFPGRQAVGQMAFLAHGIPGTILALALIWFWLRVGGGLPIYGTLGIIIVGLVTTALAFGSRSLTAALLQVHVELEEAAQTSGASPFTAVRRVVVPILMPALGGLWIWVALQSVRNVTVPLMLQSGSGNTVLSSYLWQEWNNGSINIVGAIGVAMIVGMLFVTIIVARIGMAPARGNG